MENETRLSWSIRQGTIYDAVYAKIEIELSWPIRKDTVYDKKTDKITMWSILQVWPL